jgi:uncharacterized membrane protein YhaH (DUF805 family)
MNWYLKALRNYVSVDGRARRREYWMFFLIYIGIVIAATILDSIIGMGLISSLVALVHVLPSICVGVRRLHDINRSGWWLLVALVPFIGWIIALYWAVKEGDTGSNNFGDDPKAEGEPA